MAYKRKQPVDILKENMSFLDEMIQNPSSFGSYVLIRKTRNNETKIPINLSVFEFRNQMEKKIRKLNRQIFKKLGLGDVPDGIK